MAWFGYLDEVRAVGADDKFYLGPSLLSIIRPAAIAADDEIDSVAVAVTGCAIDSQWVGWVNHIPHRR